MTSVEKHKNNINIQGDNEITKTSYRDNYRDYIIENNMHLREENLRLRQEIIQLNNTIQDNEQEQDRYDNKVKYMKSLLNNLVKIKNKYYNVYNLEKKNYKRLNQYLIDFDTTVSEFYRKHIVCQLFIYLTAFLITFTNDKYTIILLTKFALSVFWFYKSGTTSIEFYRSYNILITDINHKYNIENINIEEIIKETQTLERETTSLDNWICEI